MPLNKETKPKILQYFGNMRQNLVALNAFYQSCEGVEPH